MFFATFGCFTAWPNSLRVPGTKRPVRLFFAPVTLPGKDPVPELFFAYKNVDAKLPHNLKLEPVPQTDLGQCGLWNHWEFFLRLLSLGEASRFEIQEVSFEQSSLCRYFAMSVATNLGRPGHALAARPARPSVPAFSEEDWSMFDDPLLSDGASRGHGELGRPTEDEDIPAWDVFFEDDLGLEMDLQSDAAAPAEESDDDELLNRRVLEIVQLPGDGDDDAKSDAGQSVASRMSGQTKEVATDVDLLQRVLGPRP